MWFDIFKQYFEMKLFTKKDVADAVKVSWLTEDEYEEIVGEKYPEKSTELVAQSSSESTSTSESVVNSLA